MIKEDKYKSFQRLLHGIPDMERVWRKIELKKIEPCEFANLLESYETCLQIANICYSNDVIRSSLIPNIELINGFIHYIGYCKQIFNIDKMLKVEFCGIEQNFFNHGMILQVDQLEMNIKDVYKVFDQWKTFLTDKIIQKTRCTGNYKSVITLKNNDKDGYYFHITHGRYKGLLSALQAEGNNISNSFTVQSAKGYVKLYVPYMKEYTEHLKTLKEQFISEIKPIYFSVLDVIVSTYGQTIKTILSVISQIDVLSGLAQTSIENNYCKPEIIESGSTGSFLICKNLRHPIVEKLNTSTQYVSNDIEIGGLTTQSPRGIVLFGVNGIGKSVLLKSIGIAVVLAQMGCYIPASYAKVGIFSNIITRITGDDNLFRNLSTFTIEMSELRTIINRSTEKSLVLGDELCRGTEVISAVSLLASSIINLSKRNVNFMFTTHLHSLTKIQLVQELTNISFKHLRIIYDHKKEMLIYDRSIKDGSGPDIYGLEVAQAMGLPQEFIQIANSIRKSIMKTSVYKQDLIEGLHSSRYNQNVYMCKCIICGSFTNLDVHHIQPQKLSRDDKMIHLDSGAVNKDQQSNMISLCKTCHQKVHNETIKIHGFINTTAGIKLSVEYDGSTIFI